MCRRTICLAFVILSASVLPVRAAALVFDDGSGIDHLWSTALNWDINTVPTSADTTNIGSGLTCVIDSSVNGSSGALTLLGGGILDMDGGSLAITSITGPPAIAGILKVGDDATVGTSLDVNDANLSTQTGLVTSSLLGAKGDIVIRGNSHVTVGTRLYAGQSGVGTVTISGNAVVTTGDQVAVGVTFPGDGTLNITGSATLTTAAGKIFIVGSGGGGAKGTMYMDGGTINVGGAAQHGYSAGSIGTIYMSAGTINTAGQYILGNNGSVTQYMTGGTINSLNNLRVGSGAAAIGKLYLAGGTINATDFFMNTLSIVDINNGEIIVGGDKTAKIQGYIDSGYIIAFNGHPRAQLHLDYDVSAPGRTRLWATIPDLKVAYNPVPADGSQVTAANKDNPLLWSAGDDAVTHEVYFGLNYDDVLDANVSVGLGVYKGSFAVTSYDPGAGTIKAGKTYYWRVDEVEGDGTTRHTGAVWSFNTCLAEFITAGDFNGDCIVDYADMKVLADQWLVDVGVPISADNFEAYADDAAISAAWPTAVGFVPAENQGVSTVTLETADPYSGSKAMKWAYDLTKPVSWVAAEILYQLPAPVDLSQKDYIRLWMKRHAGNSHELTLYLKVTNGGMTLTDLAADCLVTNSDGSTWAFPDEWIEWVIDVHHFSTYYSANGYNSLADITDMRGILIGTVSSVSSGGDRGTGVIDIDDIRILAVNPADTDNNGKTNLADFAEMAKDWLVEPVWP